MRKCLLWGLASVLASGCTVKESSHVPLDAVNVPEIQLQSSAEEVKSEESYFGKIVIEGVLEQEFVQGKDNRELVYHDVFGNRVDAGPNFLDYRCSETSQNLIIYGHSSRTSSILFTPLVQYLDKEFAEKHTEIIVDIFCEQLSFQLISVFLFDVLKPSDNDWMQIDFQKEFLYQQAVKRLRQRSLVEFDSWEGSKLLTLVTCNPSNSNQRIILVGICDEINDIMKDNEENEHE